MCQDKRFLISQEKKKIDSLQSQMNLHAQKRKRKRKKKELDCLCYCSASISKALDGYFLQILDDVADIFSTDKAFSVCVLCNRFGCQILDCELPRHPELDTKHMRCQNIAMVTTVLSITVSGVSHVRYTHETIIQGTHFRIKMWLSLLNLYSSDMFSFN